jgi:hypothetical protein
MDVKERLLCCQAVAIGQNIGYDNSDEDNDHKNYDTSSKKRQRLPANRGWGHLFFHFFFVSGKIGLVYQRRSRYNLLRSINPL